MIQDSEDFLKTVETKKESFIKYGIVKNVNGYKVQIQLDGEDTQTSKYYNCLFSYQPVVDDNVIILVDRENYIVLGKIER